MSRPHPPAPGSTATPDPDEPIIRWEVTGCLNDGLVIARVIRRGEPAPWMHIDVGNPDCGQAWRAR